VSASTAATPTPPDGAARVSVVIPTFNRAGMLAECVVSVLGQTHAPLEVIVIDDGSTDGTAAVAHMFPPSVRYFHKPNEGKATALNFALTHVRGDWVWFLDDDDVALPHSIEERLAALAAVPDAALVISRFLWGSSDASGRVTAGEALRWPEFTATDFYPKFLRSCFAHLNGALIRRARIDEVGGFRTDLLTSEDYDFTLRVARGARIAVCDSPSFIFRQHSGTRGPQGSQYQASERVRKFADGDAAIGRWIRASHGLAEYLGLPPGQQLDAAATRGALLARLQVMAGKGLLAEVADDALALSSELDAAGATLDRSSADAIKSAVQERYLAIRMMEGPTEAVRHFAPLRRSQAGRSILRVMGRGILGLAWWQQAGIAEKARLAGLALRLQWLAPSGTS
jgi:GT2 family glycosyltransferase